VSGDTLQIEVIFDVAVDHREFEEMFIASGVLYGIKGTSDGDMKITFGLDLYTDRVYNLNLKLNKWLKPVKLATYDYKNKNLLVINEDGQLLKYPVTCE
ncbi:hypothetical protein ILUMI_13020, partial [Ignelater luminosus]